MRGPIDGSELKRDRILCIPLVLGHEVNVSLRRPAIQMPDKRSDLIPCFALCYQNRDKRVPQGMVSVQPFEIRAPENPQPTRTQGPCEASRPLLMAGDDSTYDAYTWHFF